MNSNALLAATLLPVLLVVPAAGHPAEWAIDPVISSRASVTDNLNLTPGVHEATSWGSLTPEVTFARRTEVSDVSGVARITVNRYPSDPDLDTTDQFYYAAAHYRSERTVWGLVGTLNEDSTLQSELATTGVVQTRVQRTLLGVSPSWAYSLGERSTVFANLQYNRANYEAGSGLVDYTDSEVSGGYSYLLSELTTVSLTGSFRRFETDNGSVVTDTYSINAGIDRSVGERLKTSFNFGYRRSDSLLTQNVLFCPVQPDSLCDLFGIPRQLFTANSKNSDDGFLLNATAEYRWERTRASVVASQDINPTGTGVMVETDRLGTKLSHEFSAKLSGLLAADYLHSRYLGGVANDTDFFRIESSLTWKLDERWTLGAGYTGAWQKVETAPESAVANTVFVNLGYIWPRQVISH